jgi:hypothetical protein
MQENYINRLNQKFRDWYQKRKSDREKNIEFYDCGHNFYDFTLVGFTGFFGICLLLILWTVLGNGEVFDNLMRLLHLILNR